MMHREYEIEKLRRQMQREPWRGAQIQQQIDMIRHTTEPSECEKSMYKAAICCIPQTVTGFNSPGKFFIGYESLGVACFISAGLISVLCPKEDCKSNARDAMTPLVNIGVTAVVCGLLSGFKWMVNTIKEKCYTADDETVHSGNLRSIVIDSGRGGSERIMAV